MGEQSAIVATLQAATPAQWLLAAAALLVAHVVYNLTLHPLASYPGPLSARMGVPGFWATKQAYKREFAWHLQALHDKYGPVVRTSSNHLSFSTPEAAQTLYAHGVSHTYPKTRFYSSIQVYPNRPSVFSETDPDLHAAHRRAISSAYSMNTLVKLEQYIEPLMDVFVECLEKAGKNGAVDMAKWLHYFAMDSVGEIAFGKSFGFVKDGSDPDRILLGVSNLSHWGGVAGWLPPLSQWSKKIQRRLSGEPGGDTVGKVTEPLIAKRFEILAAAKDAEKGSATPHAKEAAILAEREDMLAKFIESKNPLTGQQFDRIDVLRTAISVVGAGSDTTATTLTAFLGYLVRHPQVYKDLQKEIDEAYESGTLTHPVQYSQAVKLDFLQACLKETLRIHPAVGMSLPRYVAAKEGLILRDGGVQKYSRSGGDGIVLPQGTELSVSAFVLHRSKAAFGDDAREYKPSRWLNLDESRRKEMERNNLTFGGGARQCIGKNISLMEMNKILPTILRAFEFSIPTDKKHAAWRDSDGRWGTDVPWHVVSTWFLTIETFPLNVKRRPDIELR